MTVISGYAMKKVAEDTEVYRRDGINGTGIYIGSLSCLEQVDNMLWRTVREDEYEIEVLTLSEIASQLPDIMITVITESPFSGNIYQYGNYGDGEWWEIGSTCGYA